MLRPKISFVVICSTYLTFCFFGVSFLHFKKVSYMLLKPQNSSLMRKTSDIPVEGRPPRYLPSPLQNDPGHQNEGGLRAAPATRSRSAHGPTFRAVPERGKLRKPSHDGFLLIICSLLFCRFTGCEKCAVRCNVSDEGNPAVPVGVLVGAPDRAQGAPRPHCPPCPRTQPAEDPEARLRQAPRCGGCREDAGSSQSQGTLGRRGDVATLPAGPIHAGALLA